VCIGAGTSLENVDDVEIEMINGHLRLAKVDTIKRKGTANEEDKEPEEAEQYGRGIWGSACLLCMRLCLFACLFTVKQPI